MIDRKIIIFLLKNYGFKKKISLENIPDRMNWNPWKKYIRTINYTNFCSKFLKSPIRLSAITEIFYIPHKYTVMEHRALTNIKTSIAFHLQYLEQQSKKRTSMLFIRHSQLNVPCRKLHSRDSMRAFISRIFLLKRNWLKIC